MKKFLIIFILLFSVLNCKEDKGLNRKLTPLDPSLELISYAKGFVISNFENYTVLEIKNPWPKSEKSFRYALIPREMAPKVTLNTDDFDAILLTPIESIVVTSTTHIPALELLNVEVSLVGFPGTEYISSITTRQRIDQGHVRELGKNEGINTEVLLELNPDVMIGFGIDGNNKTFETVQKSGIPIIYNGDWVEASALAKAEWVKFFGALYQKEKEADVIFKQIETDYLEAKSLAAKVKNRPTVLSGAMHKDIWYLPSGTSPEAQLLKDANVDYLWSDTKGSGSLALNFESVLVKAQAADIWLNPSFYPSLQAIEKANSHYTKFKAFQEKEVYSFVNKTGETGGVLYYELGMARPDLVLKDLIKICHPELMEDYQPFFFERLK